VISKPAKSTVPNVNFSGPIDRIQHPGSPLLVSLALKVCFCSCIDSQSAMCADVVVGRALCLPACSYHFCTMNFLLTVHAQSGVV